MRRFFAMLALVGLSTALATGMILAQGKGSGVRKKGPPTFFEKEVENAFFKDVLRAHGKGKGVTIATVGGQSGTFSKTPGKTVDPGGGAKTGWAKVISADALESEIKSSINLVGRHVSSKSQWNKGHREVRVIYTVLALSFGVIAQYDGNVRFKKEAATLRDLLARSAANSKVNDERAMKEAKIRLEDLMDLRNGGSVAIKDDAEPAVPFAAVADVSEIMKRMEMAFQGSDDDDRGLNKWTADAGAFKANKGDILHEAQLIGMFGKVLQDESYDFGDDFIKIAKEVEAASGEIAAAVKLGNLQNAQTAVGKITKACSNCHEEFR